MAIAHKLALALARLEQEFGMTPSARSRIQVPSSELDEQDPLGEFLRIAGA